MSVSTRGEHDRYFYRRQTELIVMIRKYIFRLHIYYNSLLWICQGIKEKASNTSSEQGFGALFTACLFNLFLRFLLLSIILRLPCVDVGGVARREIRFDMRFERQRQAFQIICAARDSDGDLRLALGRDDAVGLRFSRALCDSHNEIRPYA